MVQWAAACKDDTLVWHIRTFIIYTGPRAPQLQQELGAGRGAYFQISSYCN